MLTNNYVRAYRGQSTYISATNASQSFYWGAGTTPIQNFLNMANINYFSGNNANPYWALDVGFGDTSPTKSDYCLVDSNYSNRKLTCVSVTKASYNVEEIYNFIGTFRNDGSENVTVKEIGIFFKFMNSSSTGLNYYGMMARSVLDTPVTISPGEQYAFTYRVLI